MLDKKGAVFVLDFGIARSLGSMKITSTSIVLGTPDPKWGEQVFAIVVKKTDTRLTEKILIQYSKENLSAYKVPKRVEFRESIPKTPYGKYDKKKVRAEYWKDQERKI